ncbi:GGDEF domain-containing protein [uncultured Ruminococcus sp.]|uniref:GGDEF domain-containing protein n=1 Tax=uncultured Ruminococcus sp. TaxID=165186 RepID=UPI0025FCAE82|nr:GGDEF domain-containing protein [uncultured Ruminococcus sp.]
MNGSAIYISYVITEMFCIFFSIGIIVKANKNVGTDLQMRHFRGMALFFIIYLMSDIFWALGQGGLVPFNTMLNKFTNTVGLIAVTLLTLGWCIFVIYRIDQNKSKNMKLLMGMHYAIAAVDCMITIASVFNGFYFYIDENDIFQFADGYIVHIIFIFIQLFGSGIYSFAQSFSNKQVKLKKEYRLPLLFIIIPSATAILEGILPLSPIVSLGIFLPIHFAFLEIQNSEIYSDALTGLNNRRRMEIFLQDMIHGATEEKSFRIHMIDVNDFKQVNDKFGHIVGDRTLQLVADALHNVSDKLHGFCARYGGDEFVLIVSEEAEVQEAIQNEVNALREKCADLIPTISVCTGCATCRSGAITAAQLIAQADEQLYIQKEIFHGRRKPTEDTK